jgi:hypothetical protein
MGENMIIFKDKKTLEQTKYDECNYRNCSECELDGEGCLIDEVIIQTLKGDAE